MGNKGQDSSTLYSTDKILSNSFKIIGFKSFIKSPILRSIRLGYNWSLPHPSIPDTQTKKRTETGVQIFQ